MRKILFAILLFSSAAHGQVRDFLSRNGVVIQMRKYDSASVAASRTPIGGTTGQVLTKNSNTNYDYSWITPTGGGGGADSTIFYTKYRSDTSRSNIYTALAGKQPTGNYLTAADIAGKVNYTDTAAQMANYLRKTGSAALLTNFPTLNQNTTGTAGGLSANISESQVTNLTTDLAAKLNISDTSNMLTGYLRKTGSAANLTNFPTFNQNTTGTAAGLTTGRTISGTGDATFTTSSFDGTANVSGAVTVSKINGTALSGLATGILKNTTTTGVPSIAVAGDFPVLNQNTSGSAATLTTPRNIWGQSFDGSAAVSGSLTAVTDITGGASNMVITAGTGNSRTLTMRTTTSGGTATAALTLAADQSATFANTVNATTFVGALTGNASTATVWTTARSLWGNSVNGSADITSIIASTYGGTGNGFTKFSGPATSERTFILPNASATVLTDNAAVTIAQGGTGQTSAANARVALLPSLTGNSLKNLRVNAGETDVEWATASGSGDMVLASVQTVTGAKTFNDTKLLMRNAANTFNGSFTNTNTADRVYTLKDAAGTIAFTSDITGTNSGTNTGDQTITLTSDVTGSGTGSFATTIAAPSETTVNNNTGGWVTKKVSGSDVTTTGQALVDVTGLISGTVSASATYEVDGLLIVTTSAVTTGTEYGLNCTGTGADQSINWFGPTTETAGVQVSNEIGTGNNNIAGSPAFLTTSAMAGAIWFHGYVTTGTGSPTMAIRHLKVTSGTSTVKIGSTFRYRKL